MLAMYSVLIKMVRSSTFFVVLFAAIALAIVESRTSSDLAEPEGQYIPQRCIDNTFTSVTCENMKNSNDYLVPHPDDCELFYFCVSPELPPICLQCPANLHFNRKEHVCDYAENAGCQSES